MAIASSNPFSVGIRVPPTSSIPTVQDEIDTYVLWGWTTLAGANPAYNTGTGLTGSSQAQDFIHSDTEGDDVWTNLQAYNRRTNGNNGYYERALSWRNYYVNNFEGSDERSYDTGFLYDHFYGWGLVQWATQFNDPVALAEAVRITDTLHAFWSTRSGTWPTAGMFSMAYFGHRAGARNLRAAVAVADASQNANAIELRDRLIDLWVASPDWDATRGMYWFSQEQMGYSDLINPPWNLVYANGDRAAADFQVGLLAEAFFAAAMSPGVTPARKAALKSKIVAMAAWALANCLDPVWRYSGNYVGIYGRDGTSWHSNGDDFRSQPGAGWDGHTTPSWVNLLVMGYKFTGDARFLDGTPANGYYPAKYVFNRGSKSVFGSTTARTCGDNEVANFVDTVILTNGGSPTPFFSWNKGFLQYTYLIFENGGAPTVL